MRIVAMEFPIPCSFMILVAAELMGGVDSLPHFLLSLYPTYLCILTSRGLFTEHETDCEIYV